MIPFGGKETAGKGKGGKGYYEFWDRFGLWETLQNEPVDVPVRGR